MANRPVVQAFDAECAALLGIVQTLEPVDFERATNCPPWTLHELLVHVAFSLRMPDPAGPVDLAAVPTGVAADYYRRPERDTVDYRSGNVKHARRAAGTVLPEDVVALFAGVLNQTSGTVAALDPAQRVEAGGRALTVDAHLLTRLMSVAAHGVDVAITLSRAPWTTARTLTALRPVLIDLLGQEPPGAWTDRELLEIGTGRRPLAAADRDALGSLATRFPLLS